MTPTYSSLSNQRNLDLPWVPQQSTTYLVFNIRDYFSKGFDTKAPKKRLSNILDQMLKSGRIVLSIPDEVAWQQRSIPLQDSSIFKLCNSISRRKSLVCET